MTMRAIEGFLLETIGLDSESIGNNTVQRTVTQRMRAIGVAAMGEYLNKLKKDPRELQGLIDAVTVPETWFFRDKDPFHMLSNLVRSRWVPPSRTKPLRILSLPCATGEEPYSIAMVLKDMGYNAETVRTDAVDSSVRALERAQQASYGPHSFRGDEGNYLSKYFEKTAEGFVLHDAIRRMVFFCFCFLLFVVFLLCVVLFVFFFCCFVFFFFCCVLLVKVIVKLHRLLVQEGVLFVV